MLGSGGLAEQRGKLVSQRLAMVIPNGHGGTLADVLRAELEGPDQCCDVVATRSEEAGHPWNAGPVIASQQLGESDYQRPVAPLNRQRPQLTFGNCAADRVRPDEIAGKLSDTRRRRCHGCSVNGGGSARNE